MAVEDASLAAVEAQLSHYLVTNSEDSEDDADYIPTVPSPEELTTMRQDPPVQPEPQLLLFQRLWSLSLIHSLLFFRSSLISRIDFLQLSKACKPSRLASGRPRHLCSRGYASSRRP